MLLAIKYALKPDKNMLRFSTEKKAQKGAKNDPETFPQIPQKPQKFTAPFTARHGVVNLYNVII